MNKRMVTKLTDEITSALFAGDWANIPVEANSPKFDIYYKTLKNDITDAINEVIESEKKLEDLGVNEEGVVWLVEKISNHDKKDEISYILSKMAAMVFEENWREDFFNENDDTNSISEKLNDWLIGADDTDKMAACTVIISSLGFGKVLNVFDNEDDYIAQVAAFERKIEKIEDQQWMNIILGIQFE